jgi:hypothetical protein
MSSFEDIVKNQEETQYREVKQTTRTQREKLRALRDEFGFQPTTPQPQTDEENND